jgi:hypothetical protein
MSTYRTGENRVTSSTMAVFERIDLALVQELLRAVTGMGSELQAVSFENQVAAPDTVPDAQISAGSPGGSRRKPKPMRTPVKDMAVPAAGAQQAAARP